MDVIGYLYDALPPIDHHRTYRHGPYDVNLQNAIDSLGFRGLVLIRNVGKTNYGGIQATYELTQAGLAFGNRLRAHGAFKGKYRIAMRVGQNLQEYGWGRLIDLVYGEPTFMSARTHGYGHDLTIQDGLENSAATIFRVIENLMTPSPAQSSISEEYVADLFMDYLDQMATR